MSTFYIFLSSRLSVRQKLSNLVEIWRSLDFLTLAWGRVVRAIARVNLPGGLSYVGRSTTMKGPMAEKMFVIFHPFAEKPTMDGFAQNFARGSSRGRNHLFQILCRSVEGFRICAGSNFAILHWLSRSPLTQICASARLISSSRNSAKIS